MADFLERTRTLIGDNAIEKLKKSRVIVFGIGGVGGYTVEALVRSGIGEIDIVDNDKVSISNLNRQIVALNSTIGEYKVDVMKKRALDINPDLKINTYKLFFDEKTNAEIDFLKYDYIVDAIDSVKSKLLLIELAKNNNIAIISSMGTGNKLNPLEFEIADIFKTSVCPLARIIRTELKKRGIKDLKVLYSKEKPYKDGSKVPSSISFVPSIAGLIIASEVIKDIIEQ